MTKVSTKHVASERFGTYVNNLWSAFTLMDSKSDVRLLFRDLFTHTEYKMFTKRLEIARCLLRGETYDNIVKNLHVTGRTINTVSNMLSEQGSGYRKAHNKLTQIETKQRSKTESKLHAMGNPFHGKIRPKTVIEEVAKLGLRKIHKAIKSKVKSHSAKKSLPI